jgi:DNA-binding MarR family transcriptional regulator
VLVEHFRILEILNAREPRAMGELAAEALIETPTLTKVIDKMASEGLVYRTADSVDRRRVLVLATADGKALFKRLRGAPQAQERRIAESLAGTKAEELKTLLRELLQ